jgi:sugar lactone lactonase YvrE
VKALRFLLGAGALGLPATPALAGGTTVWRVQTEAAFTKGDLDNVVVSSAGEVALGMKLTKVATEEIGVWSSCVTADGVATFGTGNHGKIFRLEGDGLKTVYEGKDLVVACLAVAPDGKTVYAGTIPEGRIVRVGPDGTAAEFAALSSPEASVYVWSLAVGPDGTVYAGTGEEGKIYRIGADGKATVLYDCKDDHVLSLAVAPDGSLYAGTTFEGILYRIAPDGKATVAEDFVENEVRSLHVAPPYLYLGVNKSKKFKPKTFVQRLKRAVEKSGEGGPEERSPFQELFDGSVYRMNLETQVLEKMYEFAKTYVIDVKGDREGNALVATGDEGRVYRVRPDGTYFTLIDFNENQAMTLTVANGALAFLGTGNPGSVYRVDGERAGRGTYTSEVLDAKFRSDWGRLEWLGEGSIAWQTRSGNTQVPDDLWSAWSPVADGRGVAVPSPPGRFFQFRAVFEKDPGALLRSVQVAYLPENQRPKVAEFTVNAGSPDGAYKGEPPASREIEFDWKAEDPDGDPLLFDLSWRRQDGGAWVRSNRDAPIDKKKWKIDAATLPDGWYTFKVEASDRGNNPPGRALRYEKVSEPVLVDNRKPEVTGLKVEAGGSLTVSGLAEDSFSNIARLEFSLDGGPWKVLFPTDSLCDRPREEFQFHLEDPGAGTHSLAVRAFDARGNAGVSEVTFTSNR